MPTPWPVTSHDWAAGVDIGHLESIRARSAEFAPTGVTHLVLEVVAYAADEAAYGHGSRCEIRLFADGSIAIADDGRGTDTRRDEDGRLVKKPVVSSKDLRYFDATEPALLPDGHPRRGMSLVAALSEWLVHSNRRANGSWRQRYERGVPVTDLVEIADDQTTGTRIHFRPDPQLAGLPEDLTELTTYVGSWPQLQLRIGDHRRPSG